MPVVPKICPLMQRDYCQRENCAIWHHDRCGLIVTASLSPRASWGTPSRKKSSARFLPSSTIWPKLSKDAANSDLLDLPLLRSKP